MFKSLVWLGLFSVAILISPGKICAENSSNPEKKLDKILHISWADGNLIRFLLHREGHAKSEKYDKLFTQKLLKTLARDEKIVVNENCGNEYHPGEVCGLDYNPLTCSQKTYIVTGVQVVKMNEKTAILRYESNGHVTATYKMVKHQDEWLLDGIGCPTGKSYNFESR